MQMCILVIYDKAVEAYSPPYATRALGQGLRDFIEEVNNPQSRISRSPDDFTLFHLGYFDDNSAMFDLFADGPRPIAHGHEQVRTVGS